MKAFWKRSVKFNSPTVADHIYVWEVTDDNAITGTHYWSINMPAKLCSTRFDYRPFVLVISKTSTSLCSTCADKAHRIVAQGLYTIFNQADFPHQRSAPTPSVSIATFVRLIEARK